METAYLNNSTGLITIIEDEEKWNIQTSFVQLAGRAEENFRNTEVYINCNYDQLAKLQINHPLYSNQKREGKSFGKTLNMRWGLK